MWYFSPILFLLITSVIFVFYVTIRYTVKRNHLEKIMYSLLTETPNTVPVFTTEFSFQKFLREKFKKWLEHTKLALNLNNDQKETYLLFEQAGWRNKQAPVIFILYRILTFAAVFVLTLVILNHISLPVIMDTVYVKVLSALILGGLGAFSLKFLLLSWIQRRSKSMEEDFLKILDMVIITLKTGLSLENCIEEANKEIGIYNNQLHKELALLNIELQILDREQALINFKTRFISPIAKEFVSIVIQSQKQGSSIVEGIKIISEEWNKKYFIALEEHAQKLPVKITLITAAFFLPPLFMFTLGPLLIKHLSP